MKFVKITLLFTAMVALTACDSKSPTAPSLATATSLAASAGSSLAAAASEPTGAGIISLADEGRHETEDRKAKDDKKAKDGKGKDDGNDDDDDAEDDDSGMGGTAITATLTANSTSIQRGQSSTLTWKTTNAKSATLNGSTVAVSGSRVVSPTQTMTYTLLASAPGKSANAKATVTVTSGPAPPPSTAPTATLTGAPSTIQSGGATTLTWTTANATSATLDGAPVMLNGTQMVSPTATHTYRLVATGSGTSANATATVTVTGSTPPPPPPPPPSAPTASLMAGPSTIQSGQATTLTWTTSNATSVTLDGATVVLDGMQVVSPMATQTYTLVATGSGGIATSSATVTVNAQTPPTLTYTADIQPHLSGCTVCHGNNGSAGVDLRTYTSTMLTVTPGDANSRLVRSTDPIRGSMFTYVVGTATMTATEVANLIRDWVLSGAAQ